MPRRWRDFDLLRPINHLASHITKWTKECDRKLRRLVCYVNGSLKLRMVNWVGDKPGELFLELFSDADFAGDKETMRSTSGAYLRLAGVHTSASLSGSSRKQT